MCIADPHSHRLVVNIHTHRSWTGIFTMLNVSSTLWVKVSASLCHTHTHTHTHTHLQACNIHNTQRLGLGALALAQKLSASRSAPSCWPDVSFSEVEEVLTSFRFERNIWEKSSHVEYRCGSRGGEPSGLIELFTGMGLDTLTQGVSRGLIVSCFPLF